MDPQIGLSKCGMQRRENVYTPYMVILPLCVVCISMKKGRGNPVELGNSSSVTCELGACCAGFGCIILCLVEGECYCALKLDFNCSASDVSLLGKQWGIALKSGSCH